MDQKNNLFIPGGLLIGLGIGLAFDKAAVGIFIGLGAGFIISTLISLYTKK